MEKYSASYGNTARNFVIQNITGEYTRTKYDGVICVIKNILQRGLPVPPSDFLKERLGVMASPINESLLMITADGQEWFNKIKGNSENKSDNPAEVFFNSQIPEYFGDYAFVRNLMLPEANIEEIAPSHNGQFIDRQVDFYIPQAKLAIEIDGAQHASKIQTSKDLERDKHLKRNGIKTIRIRTQSIHAGNQEFQDRIQDVLQVLEVNKEINAYKHSLARHNMNPDELLRVQYDIVLRFQLLVLSLLQRGRLKLAPDKWEISIKNPGTELEALLRVAIDDLFLWFSHLCKLSKLAFIKPDVIINPKRPSDTGIVIDVDIKKRWTDEADFNRDIIYIRNDYFDNHDYFRLSTSDSIQYALILDGEASDIPDLRFFLRNIFGFDDFRDGQLPIIVNAMARQDTIGILPTGSGKSLCYQLTAMLQPCISFVVCPILALMYDQKDNMDKLGITRTNYISSEMNGVEKGEVLKSYSKGKYFLLWISPERFQSLEFRNTMQLINKERNISLAVIDEVHCLSEWGHDFRTSYLNLVRTIKSFCPEATFLGLTATASQFVLEDLKREFEIEPENIKTVSDIRRGELNFRLIRVAKKDKYKALLELLNSYQKKHGESLFATLGNQTKSGLIFTLFKSPRVENSCTQLANKLSTDLNIVVETFHGNSSEEDDFRLEAEEKRRVQDGFKNNEYPLLTATKAFGMGIDKPNIRYTIHFGMPWSIEAFYQEAGRAGRDKQKAECTILYTSESEPVSAIDKLFEIDTEIIDIERIQKILSKDLGDILYLWLRNNKGIDEDLKMMIWVKDQVANKSSIQNCEPIYIKCNPAYKKSDVEKALYRLSLLGIITDWTLETWGEKDARIYVHRDLCSTRSVHDKLFEFIRRYDSHFSEENENYRRYFDELIEPNNDTLLKYMKILLMWSYDNIVYQRRQAIKTMWDACENFKDGATLASFIENYFSFSENTLFLDQIVYNPEDYKKWFEFLFQSDEDKVPIAKSEIDKLLPSLQRYLESYRYNPGLNYLSGMLRLLCDKFQDADGLSRLSDAFDQVLEFSQEGMDYLINNTLIIGSIASSEGREQLGEFLTSRFPERSIQIHHALSDNASLLTTLRVANSKLEWVKEKIQW